MLAQFKTLVKTSSVYGLGAVGGSILGFFLLPIYTRFLSPSDFGILETLITITSILTIFLIFGMDGSFFRFSFDSQDVAHKKQVVATTTMFLSILGLVVTLALLTNSAAINRVIFGGEDYTFLLQLTFVFAAMTAVLKIPMSIFRIRREPAKYAIVAIFHIFLTASLCIFLIVGLGRGVQGKVEGMTIAIAIILAIAYCLTRKHISFRPSASLLKRMLKYAIPLIPTGLSLWILSLSDRLFLLHFADTTELGLYAIGMRFAMMITLVIGAFGLGWGEFAFSLLRQDNRNQIYSRTLTYFVFVTGVILLGLSLFAEELVSLMTTPEFLKASTVIPILGLAMIFNGCHTVLAIGLNITKKMGAIFPVTAISAVLNLILNYLLIPQYGMMGAAVATLISYLLMAVLMWYASQRVYPIKYEWGRIGKVFFSIGMLLLISKFVVIDVFYLSVLFNIGLFVLFFPLLYLIKFLNDEEKRIIRVWVPEILNTILLKSWRKRGQ